MSVEAESVGVPSCEEVSKDVPLEVIDARVDIRRCEHCVPLWIGRSERELLLEGGRREEADRREEN